MGFFFALIGYLTAVAVMVGSAIAVAAWITRPVPEQTTATSTHISMPQVNDSARRMRGADAALTSQKSAKRHALPPRRRAARRDSPR